MRMEKQTWVWQAGIRRSLIRERERERDVEKEKQRSKLFESGWQKEHKENKILKFLRVGELIKVVVHRMDRFTLFALHASLNFHSATITISICTTTNSFCWKCTTNSCDWECDSHEWFDLCWFHTWGLLNLSLQSHFSWTINIAWLIDCLLFCVLFFGLVPL